MLTFFTVDFIPNRDLRLLISDWLNTLLRDPVLQKHMDGFVSDSFTILFSKYLKSYRELSDG